MSIMSHPPRSLRKKSSATFASPPAGARRDASVRLRFAAQARAAALAIGASVLLFSHSAQAASATWDTSPTDGNWEASGAENNWSTGAATYPGSTSGTTNTDTATFLTSSTTAISINSAPLNIGSITFGNVASASAFTIGTTGGNALLLSSGGSVSISSSRTTAGAAETINAPIVLEPATGTTAGAYTFSNASGLAGDILSFGGPISGGTTTQGITLTLTGSSGTANTIDGVISNGGATGGVAISKTSSGTWRLTNTDTYSGATAVTAGTLTLANGTAAGSAANSAFTIAQQGITTTAILGFDSSAATVSQTTTRAASVTFNGNNGSGSGFAAFQVLASTTAGVKTIDQVTGAFTLNSGAYVLPKINNGAIIAGYYELSAGSFVRNAGSIIDFSRGVTAAASPGVNPIASQTTGSSNIVFGTAPTLIGGTLGTTSAGILKGAFVSQTIATYDSTYGVRALTSSEFTALTTSGMTTQNASLTSGGTLTLTADETVNSLSLGFGSGNGGLTAGNQTLTITSGVISVGQGSTLGNTTVAFGSAEGLINVQNTRSLTVNSILTGSGGLTIALNDATATSAYAVLNGANTYTGTTRFIGNNSGMSVKLTNSLALQNTTLDYNNYGASFTFGNGTTTGQTAYTFGGLEGAQPITLANNNATVQAVALTVGGDGDSTTYSGILSDGTAAGGSLTKIGAGTLTLSAGNNTFTGITSISAGTLSVNSFGTGTAAQPLGENAGLNLGGASTVGTLQFAGNGGTLDKNIALGAAGGTISYTGGVTNDFNVTGTITGSSNLTVNNTSPGAKNVILGGANNSNSFTGNLIITAGAVRPGGTTQLNVNNTLSVQSGASFNFGGTSTGVTFAGLNDIPGATGGAVTGGALNNPVLTLGGSGTYSYSGTISHAGSLVMSGSGTQTLSGTNTYTGGTTVSGGALLVNNTTGSGTGPGSVAVNSGGTLGGTGILAATSASATVTVNTGGTLAPGATVGASTGALTLSATSGVTINGTLTIGLNGSIGSSLNITAGTLTLGNASTLNITGTTGAGENAAGDYDIANYTSLTGSFANASTVPSGYNLVYGGTSFANSGGFDIELDPITAVPEPSTWAAGLLSLGVLGFHLRRKRKLAA